MNKKKFFLFFLILLTIANCSLVKQKNEDNTIFSSSDNPSAALLQPKAPGNLQVSAYSVTQIDLTWTDHSDNEDIFKIEMILDNKGSPGTFSEIATVSANTTSYSKIGLSSSTKYYFRIRAYNNTGDSEYSNLVNATTNASLIQPQAPGNLQVSTYPATQINLTWTDNSDNEDIFKIEMTLDNEGSPGTFSEIATVSANTTSYSKIGLSSSTKYYFRIRAYNSAGYSEYSNTAIEHNFQYGETGNPDTDAIIPNCSNNCYYIRADASGNSDGSDWTNAWTQLPDNLIRGSIYYISDGNYTTKYTFNDIQSTDKYIYIVKAIPGKHGTDIGWLNKYGDGNAFWGPLDFNEPYYVFDGQIDKGFEVKGDYEGSIINITSDHIILQNSKLDGNFQTDVNGIHSGGSCTGIRLRDTNNITIKNNEIHNIADDGLEAHRNSHLSFIGNTIHKLHGCGTDGACGPCYNGHSDGIEIFKVDNSEFIGNFIYNISGTSAFFFGSWGSSSADYCENIVIANNIFYDQASFMAYIKDADNIKLYNNIFWGIIRDGKYGGLSIGNHVTNLDMYNNIILSINYSNLGALYDPENHRGDYNLFGVSLGHYSESSHDIIASDPGFKNIADSNGPLNNAPLPEDFFLLSNSPAIKKGYSGDNKIIIPKTDWGGNYRNNPPNIGTFE